MPAINLRYTIDATESVAAIAAFLEVFPNISNSPDQWTGDPLSDEDWMRHKHEAWINDVINKGNRRLDQAANYSPPVDSKFVRRDLK